MPGVLAVLTGADVVADGLKPIPHNPADCPRRPTSRSRTATARRTAVAPHPLLPTDRARFVGEAVAHGGRRDRARPPRTPPSGRRSTTSRCRPSPRAAARPQPGAPQLWEHGRQRLHRRRGRRCGRDRGGVRARRPRGAARHLGAARDRRADGAARRASAPTIAASGRYTLYAGSGSVVRQQARARRRARRAADDRCA